MSISVRSRRKPCDDTISQTGAIRGDQTLEQPHRVRRAGRAGDRDDDAGVPGRAHGSLSPKSGLRASRSSEHEDEERDADHAVHREERGVEPGEVVRLSRANVRTAGARRRPPRRSQYSMPARRSPKPTAADATHADHVQHPRDADRALDDPQRRGNRVQTLRAVEVDVLQRIQDVEARHPRGDADRERDEQPPRVAPLARPRRGSRRPARWTSRGPEHDVRPAREALRVAVEEDPRRARPATARAQSGLSRDAAKTNSDRRRCRPPARPRAASAPRAGSRASTCADCARRCRDRRCD